MMVGCGKLSCLITSQTLECTVDLCLKGLAFTDVSFPPLEVEIFSSALYFLPLAAAVIQ